MIPMVIKLWFYEKVQVLIIENKKTEKKTLNFADECVGSFFFWQQQIMKLKKSKKNLVFSTFSTGAFYLILAGKSLAKSINESYKHVVISLYTATENICQLFRLETDLK